MVVETLRREGMDPAIRDAKTAKSIVEKLRREGTRLSRMQDIAGCRVIAEDVREQDWFVALCDNEFPNTDVKDRREKPSHGYRAVHVIVTILGKLIEIQIRTVLQDLWAQVSEKSADLLGQEIKYGGGPEFWRNFLVKHSETIAMYEALEANPAESLVVPDELNRLRAKIKDSLIWSIAMLEEAKKGDQQ